MPKVSVIVPFYNAEQFLGECIESILSQTLEDIEIILSDDGSTDFSNDICQNYACGDKRIKLIKREHLGKGPASNAAIDIAVGEYLSFIDADDIIENKMFEVLYDKACKNQLDIIKSAWYQYEYKNKCLIKDTQLDNFVYNKIYTIAECPEFITVQPSVWSALYRTDFINNKKIRYTETPWAFQDVAFTHKAFCQAERFMFVEDRYVYYRIDNDDASTKSKTHWEEIFLEYEEIDKFLSENPQIKSIINTQKIIRQLVDLEWNYKRIMPSLHPQFIERCKKVFDEYKVRGEITQEIRLTAKLFELGFLVN